MAAETSPDGLRPVSVGRVIISLIAVMTAVSPYLADWNETHIYNPLWPPHAKFHNGQTMLMGAACGLLALWALWGASGDRLRNLSWGTVFAGLYWLTQSGAILFPGAGFIDRGVSPPMPRIGGIEVNQVMLDAVLLTLLLGAYVLERRRIERAMSA